MRTVVLILLVLLLIGGIPAMPYWGPTGSGYGWYPSLGALVLILVVLILFGGI